SSRMMIAVAPSRSARSIAELMTSALAGVIWSRKSKRNTSALAALIVPSSKAMASRNLRGALIAFAPKRQHKSPPPILPQCPASFSDSRFEGRFVRCNELQKSGYLDDISADEPNAVRIGALHDRQVAQHF